jgi:hypothetical protein
MEISVLEWKFMAHNAIRVQIFKTPYTYAKRISEIMVVHRCYRFTLATTPLRDVSTKSAVFFWVANNTAAQPQKNVLHCCKQWQECDANCDATNCTFG